MAKKFEPLITADEVQEILAEPKETVKPIAWIPKPALTDLQWMEFASPCRIKGEVREDVIFRATYRGARTRRARQATIFSWPGLCASLFVGPHRVFGVDTDDSFHTSLVGEGRPQFRKALADRSHEHLWVDEGEGCRARRAPALSAR